MQIEYADTHLQQCKGLMFQDDIPEDLIKIFRFKKAQRLQVHTLFVRVPLDIGFLDENGRITKTFKNVKPFTNHISAVGKAFVEMRAGGFEMFGFKEGDSMRRFVNKM